MNLTNKLEYSDLLKIKDDINKIFFFRICGTGMGACACLLKEQGYTVEGGDNKFYPPMSDYLKSTGIKTFELNKIDGSFLSQYDLVVVGNVVPRNSDDARLIEESGARFISFPSALGALVLNDQNVIGIAGTHGKTTTTYFLTQIFENLGQDPGYFIGGVMEGRPPSRIGAGKYFFIESDEYDSAYFEKISKFRRYSLDHLILTSLEFDHADIFENIEQIKDQFRALIPEVKGKHIYCSDYPEIINLSKEYQDKDIIPYGAQAEIGPKNIKVENGTTTFEVQWQGETIEFKTNVIGTHNIQNITTGIIFAFTEGFSIPEVQKSVASLGLVKRRQERRGLYGKSIVIDDFAHHPKAVEVTIEAIKETYPGKKVVVIMEPHSATARSSIFQEGFTNALKKSDLVYITKLPRPTTAKGAEDLDLGKMITDLKNSSVEGGVVEDLDNLLDILSNYKESESVILVLSNGTCLGLWESKFVKDLTK